MSRVQLTPKAAPDAGTISADAMLNALPHPVIMIAPDGRIADANVAAEQFFEASIPMLRRNMLRDLVPFGSPLFSLPISPPVGSGVLRVTPLIFSA